MLEPVSVTCGEALHVDDLHDADQRWSAVVVTAATDAFARAPVRLPWRGIEMHSTFTATDGPNDCLTAGYQINRPSLRHPFTRTIETKHASGQQVLGTVISEEHPQEGLRHYPVPSADGEGLRRNTILQAEIAEQVPVPTLFCGRLAEYRYLDQDQAIRSALDTAYEVLARLAA